MLKVSDGLIEMVAQKHETQKRHIHCQNYSIPYRYRLFLSVLVAILAAIFETVILSLLI